VILLSLLSAGDDAGSVAVPSTGAAPSVTTREVDPPETTEPPPPTTEPEGSGGGSGGSGETAAPGILDLIPPGGQQSGQVDIFVPIPNIATTEVYVDPGPFY
jgi:hypothetical protein